MDHRSARLAISGKYWEASLQRRSTECLFPKRSFTPSPKPFKSINGPHKPIIDEATLLFFTLLPIRVFSISFITCLQQAGRLKEVRCRTSDDRRAHLTPSFIAHRADDGVWDLIILEDELTLERIADYVRAFSQTMGE